MIKWSIKYNNDTGPLDEGFSEWWTVTDGNMEFICHDENHANWLRNFLDQTMNSV